MVEMDLVGRIRIIMEDIVPSIKYRIVTRELQFKLLQANLDRALALNERCGKVYSDKGLKKFFSLARREIEKGACVQDVMCVDMASRFAAAYNALDPEVGTSCQMAE